jgi:hypothetical protein
MSKYAEEPRYTDDPFEEDQGTPARKPKKLFGNTDLQREALAVTGRTKSGFRDNAQHRRFTDLEKNCLGATNANIVWKAWFRYRIAETRKINAKAVLISMDKLIHNIGLENKRKEWMIDNSASVLQAAKADVTSKGTGTDEMIEGMLKRAKG